tara:strand:+ start:2192 stop:3070 length:879 start_codon:yes stop_codon:yes gene_type:complete
MIRPLSFGFNNDTSNDNYFQKNVDHLTKSKIKSNALKEFENMCSILRKNSINVVVLENDNKNLTDDVFPNNWISFHGDKYIIHSMFAKSRRAEKNTSFINMLALKNFDYELLNDYSKYEGNNMHLEGTGSVVLDRINKVAYCSISKRSNLKLFNIFCNDIGYEPIPFKSYDSRGDLIYHTNVMMCVGDDFALICYESIKDAKERKQVKTFLEKSGKTIITISLKQVDSFAGNIIQLGDNEHKIIVISKVAYNSLNEDQKNKLSKESKIISIPIPTIQTCGGGSVRCMIAELI